ncbi:hypothetical protein BKK52_07375 [Rodentibacter trehalosifermentans]|uniref:FRG domain-containing protein n=1 Tax=Rodentibacter trehalosifermentans TaxID=1908263 RepID=A0A1V3IZG8_9PAST|nr:FRG domain-containing protein [Rodentibacter trehalosifermentans]OOF47883.1 hypothetical protein BKK52_07375 [Rodentibacter trehalosifermentans]
MSEKIENVAHLAQRLKELGEPKKGYTRFFRGHSDERYELVPSIYRKDDKASDPNYLINNEDKIIKDAFTYCSDYFLPHETLFEKLVKLQHYDYKTRLLDISSNSLVGLYFAVGKSDKQEVANENEDGEVVVLDIPNEYIKYDDSDVVSILSAVSLRNKSFNITSYIEQGDLLSALEITPYIIEERENYEEMKDSDFIKIFNKELKEYGASFDEGLKLSIMQKRREAFRKIFNDLPEIARLLHDIRKDKPSFNPIIEANDFNRVVCVKAKQNNPRIAKQQGAFLLFGIDGQKIKQAEVEPSWIVLKDHRLIIDKDSKENILNELKSFGISHQSLFPELDSQAQDIMNKYKS